jgi:polyhydroxyalkanoate synthase
LKSEQGNTEAFKKRENQWLFPIANHVWGSAFQHWILNSQAFIQSDAGLRQSALNISDLTAVDPLSFAKVLQDKILDRYSTLIDVYERYITAETRVSEEPALSVFDVSSSKLLDYGLKYEVKDEEAIVLFVPSLINKSYVFDIPSENSVLKFLSDSKIRAYVVSWGGMATHEHTMGLEDFVEHRLIPMIQHVYDQNPSTPIYILGYCMGGILTLAALNKVQHLVAGAIMLAVPWDFSDPGKKRLYQGIFESVKVQIGLYQAVSGDFLKTLFVLMNPIVMLRKFQKLSQLSDVEQKQFMELEDWVNDSVALPPKVALQCFEEWFVENNLERAGRLGALEINLESLHIPFFMVIPSNDRIVDAASAFTLSLKIKTKTIIKPELGHVGVITASKAKGMVWDPMLEWIRNRSQN